MSSLPTISTSTAGMSVMPEQRRHELGAEARERQRAAPLDDQLDDVAREHEDERHQDREVGGRERVEHELGEEVGRERRRAVRQREQPGERADERGDAEQDQLGVVEERPAACGRRRAGAAAAQARRRHGDVTRLVLRRRDAAA